MDAFTPGAGKAAVTTKTTNILKILDILSASVAKIKDPEPLIIIDGFTVENKNKHEGFMKMLMQWAAYVTRSQKARVIFVADSTFEAEGGLHEIIPTAAIDEIVLGDVSLDTAVSTIGQQLGTELAPEVVETLRVLGGRFTDLRALLRRIQGGQSPQDAVQEMLTVSCNRVRDAMFSGTVKLDCTNAQLWQLIVQMAEHADLSYDDVLFSIFKGNSTPLRSLVRSNLFIMVPSHNGEMRIFAGSPLLQSAFKQLANDPLLRPGMDQLVYASLVQAETKKVTDYEAELVQLNLSGEANRAESTTDRKAFLLTALADSQRKIAVYDAKRRACESTLKRASTIQSS